MTNLMIELRRSPRTLLERDGYPGPGPGKLALVMSRAGVGKTALLVGIGIDALLSGQKVLHVALDRSVDKIRNWYDDVLTEMLRREKKLQHWPALQLEVERRRHIHTYVGQSFSVERLHSATVLLRDAMEFEPNVIIVDRLDLEGGWTWRSGSIRTTPRSVCTCSRTTTRWSARTSTSCSIRRLCS
jgi:KaiC/GvpD/RAD55 family RecA-like ATPase